MNKTILITGTSSGFGAATANYFAAKGWNVIATMRDTTKNGNLEKSGNIFVTQLDVQDKNSIDKAIVEGINHFGSIDVVVNNAGYGLFGIFESASREAIQTQFDVNVFGAMDVTRAILPYFRSNRSGTIINISSGAGAIGFPMASVYSSSKFALEGWTEGLRYELVSLGITAKIIEPGGAMQTGFMSRVGGESAGLNLIEDYLPFLEQIGKVYGGMQGTADADAVEKVVHAIYEAATDGTDRLRYSPTDDIKPILNARRNTSEEEYQTFTNSIFLAK
ncbi:Short-chain dehydrogenase [Chryseobacterium wanjuense]|jgi:NAD(P)-dependent dehydrogenase (short-subunit alcohol dehydrogenase family)|uniref:Short-chain dehydrogenase n=1 Tax=Chryseobacterium wanjuense TaxID=356305 RepID=A0A1I0NL13_9FLAO|nr:SDR family oxidoreductase [Chryseobacterium wanjuense]SEW01986.1 Short-chain dehydrogenase [Chryseobacterium wanjuense]